MATRLSGPTSCNNQTSSPRNTETIGRAFSMSEGARLFSLVHAMNAATRPVTVTIPQWLWLAIGALALMLAGTAITAVGSMVGRISEHESRISRVESSAVTQAQAGAMFGNMRQEIRSDIAGVRDEIRGLRQELRQ